MNPYLKNLNLYRVTSRPAYLSTALEPYAYTPPGALDIASRGWVSPTGDDSLVYAHLGEPGKSSSRVAMLAYRMDKKAIPGTALREALNEWLAEQEAEQGYRPGRKQAREIKERVIDSLLPRIVPTTRINRVLIWNDLMAIDGTQAQADDVLSLLEKTFKDLAVKRLRTNQSPRSAMTDWLLNGAPGGFTIDGDCTLILPFEQKPTVRFVRHPLDRKVIRSHIEAGKLCTSLALTWNDRISFILTEDFQVKRMAFLDILKEEADQQAENIEEQFAADFALQAGELERIIPALIEALGGEVEEAM